MHLSTMFSSKKDVDILIKSCLYNELSETAKEHVRNLFKELALEELQIANLDIKLSDVELEAGVTKLENLANQYLVAYANFTNKEKGIYDKPVGLLASRKTDTSEIMAMYITPDYRNQGIGKLLVREFIRIAQLKTVKVNCLTVNTPALNFYKKFGFVFDKGEDIVHGVAVC